MRYIKDKLLSCSYILNKATPWILLLLMLGYTISKGLCETPDSDTYLAKLPFRAVLYPLFLQLLDIVTFGHMTQTLVFFQIIIGWWAIVSLVRTMEESYQIPLIIKFLWIIGLVSPYTMLVKHLPFVAGYNQMIGNYIMSEALAYPLFLFSVKFAVDTFNRLQFTSLLFFMMSICLLVLTRGQFLFMYPLALIIVIYYYVKTRKQDSSPWILLLILVLSIVLPQGIQRSYNLYHHRSFASVPFTGVQLIIPALYVSQDNDLKALEPGNERKFFKKTFSELEEKGLLKSSFNLADQGNAIATHFEHSYNQSCWGIVVPNAFSILEKDSYTLEGWTSVDLLTTKIAIKLIREHIADFAQIWILNISKRLFDNTHHNAFLFTCALFIIAGTSIMNVIQKNITPITRLSLLVFFLHLSNFALVAIVEPILERYSLYTDVLMIPVAAMAIIMRPEIKNISVNWRLKN